MGFDNPCRDQETARVKRQIGGQACRGQTVLSFAWMMSLSLRSFVFLLCISVQLKKDWGMFFLYHIDDVLVVVALAAFKEKVKIVFFF